MEEASESGEEMGQERVGTESNFSYLSRNVVESNINDATALNKHATQRCAACIQPRFNIRKKACNKFIKYASNTHNTLRLQK